MFVVRFENRTSSTSSSSGKGAGIDVSLQKGTILKGMLPKLKSSKYILVYRSSLGSFDMYMSYGWRSISENVTSEQHTRALHDVTSDMSNERQDLVKWLLHANAHPASRISQYDNSHPVRCFWILLEFRNTIMRVSGHVSFAIR